MNLLKEYFPIPLMLFGALMADASRAVDEGIVTLQIISWTWGAVGGIGLARRLWQGVNWLEK